MPKKIRVAFIQKEWEDNLGILWISSTLISHGFSTIVLVEGNNTGKELQAFSPDIIGYSCYTGDQKWIFSSIKRIKASGIEAKIVIGGPHATFFPELIENELVDAVCRGEGEFALLEYARSLEEKKDPYSIRNFNFNVHGEIIRNELRPLIDDLDSLPFPDRSYYQRYRFIATNPYKIFITGRGCPYKCTFCFNHALHELYGKTARYIRRRSVGNVIEELSLVKHKWGLGEVRFSDDHFALSAQWLKEFAPSYKKEIGKPYTINTRVDVLDEEKISYLKESGCRLVCFGIETGREDLRNEVLKKNITNEQIYQAADLLRKYKIKFLTSNIIGLPNEKPEDAWKTIGINQKIGTDLPWFSMMQYYPGTQIYKEAQEMGLLRGDFSFDKISSYFKNDYLQQDTIGELQNIHSFSILVSRYKFLEPLAKFLSKRYNPNFFFRFVFLFSYILLTLKRAHFKVTRIIWGLKYYRDKVSV